MNKNNKLKKKSKTLSNGNEKFNGKNIKKRNLIKTKLKKNISPLQLEDAVDLCYNTTEIQLKDEEINSSEVLKNGSNKKRKRKNMFVNCDSMKKNENYYLDPHDNELSSSSSCEDLFNAMESSKKLNFNKCEINEPNFSIIWKNEISNDKITRKKMTKNKQCTEINNKKSKNTYDELESDIDDDNMKSIENIQETELKTETDINSSVEMNIKLSNDININNEQKINSVQFYITSSCCIFVLKHPCRLYFHGKIMLSVLSGTIEVFGHTLDQSDIKREIYSPRGIGLLYFETLDTKRNKNLNITLKKLNLTNDIIEQINTSNEDICVLALQKLENNLTKSLENYFTQSFFPKIYQNREGRYFSPAEVKLQTYFEEDPANWSVFEINNEWKSILDEVKQKLSKTRLMICGGKGVGKSTFIKYTVNKLLNSCEKVLFIDLDPGQSEFAIPGTLSATVVDSALFGPNYIQKRKPIRCNFIGEVNITHCFGQYLEAVKDLMTYCVENIDDTLPWIINYMGYSKSLGSDLILSVIQYVNPTMLVQIQSSNNKNNFSNLLQSSYVKKEIKNNLPYDASLEKINYDLRIIQSTTDNKRASQVEPKILREARIISYFSDVLISNNIDKKQLQTYCVSLSSVKLSHMNGNNENLSAILNGNLVALCSNSSNICLGFGIVRGIDTAANKLYLITPETRDTMKNVNNLVMGFIMVPISFYLNIESTNVTPYVCVKVKEKTASVPKRSYVSCQKLLKKT